MEGGLMRRKGFLLNSAVIVLLIPLLLLLATYEDVSHSIIIAQSERAQVERTYDVITFLNIEFQKALELSGKRAVVTAVDYVAVTGNFISSSYGANNTIRDFIKSGTSRTTTGYDTVRVMGGQTMRNWLSNVSKLLRDQGYIVSPSVDEIVDSMDITVGLLDAFTVVIKARIPRVKITDASGTIVYEGPIPSNGDYVYSTVDIRDLEDPFFSAITGGRYHRSIKACKFAFPTLGIRPITVANASGSGGKDHYVGKFGDEFIYNETDVWGEGFHVTNLTIDGIPVTTREVILNKGDVGILKFYNVSSSRGESGWCYPSLGYRVNFTISGGSLSNYNGYQIPIVITNPDILGKTYYTENNASIRIVEKGSCSQVPFWIEYWSNTKAIVWIKATTSMEYTMYFGEDPAYATRGNGTEVFEWFHDKEETISDNSYLRFNLSSLSINGDIAIRFRAKPSKKNQWDSGIVVKTTDESSNPQWIYFIDDTKDASNSLEVWDEYYVWVWDFWPVGHWELRRGISTQDGARGDTDFHTYEVVIEPTTNGAYVDFLDYGSDYSNYPNPIRQNPDGYLIRRYTPPLTFLYLINLNNGNNNDAIFKWIFIRKYIRALPTETFSRTETNTQTETAAAVYDIQPFQDCLEGMRYIATENGWSFFERLEGSDANHAAYVTLSHQMQDEMGYKYGNQYYPIGLVSFMIPDPTYDRKLFNLFLTLGISVEEGQSSTDYYFLNYYFGDGTKVQGYRVWGVSEGTIGTSNLEEIPFFLDPQTSEEILGSQGTCDLLYGYTCP